MNHVNSDKKTVTNSFIISLILHAVILSLLAFVSFSAKQVPVSTAKAATARIKAVSNLADKAQILPKPKVISSQTGQIGKRPQFELDQTPKPIFGASIEADLIESLPSENLSMYPAEEQTARFFENSLSEKRFCFVVDCSGSMQGVFERVKAQLINSIGSLEPDRYFQIVFFGDNQLYKFSQTGLVRASGPVKQQAIGFVHKIRPKGRTNAVQALTIAMMSKDLAANSPDVIYFLTDGFNLAENGDDNLLADVINFRNNFCDTTRINTIGFWPKAQDEFILRQLAQATGGSFTLINK
ncbi:MAG: VWA domain-containing protein [Sedimentisphaerales bacterium]|nr:VWA domain-containing protein [Sedimentisphaerales bacterium]